MQKKKFKEQVSYVFLILISIAIAPSIANAYIGPGAGFAFLGSTFVFLITILMALATIFFWPLQWSWRIIRGKGFPRKARAKKVVVVGLDGLEPTLVDKYMGEGLLPNLKKLSEEGHYNRLATTLPALSPVAWSTFQTGVNPGAHNIFDFLTRDKRFCLPLLSSVDTQEDKNTGLLSKFLFRKSSTKIRLLRKSQPFWKILGERGVFCNILRVPISYPPEKVFGNVLSAMCTPDLRGTQGTFSVYTTDKNTITESDATGDATGGEVHLLEASGNTFTGKLIGPVNPSTNQPLTSNFTVVKSDSEDSVLLEVADQKHNLKLNEFTPWIKVEFHLTRRKRVSGICRFCLRSIEPNLHIYVSPINVDPIEPALPIATPLFYSGYLARKHGVFGTLGLMEDTWGRNELALNDHLFLEQTYLTHNEREKMLFDALERTDKGLCVCVFDASDRIQHMFWRYIDKDHPSPREDHQKYGDVIKEMYIKMDQLVGKVQEKLNPDDTLIVMSDHGFTSFRRCVNINSWLEKEGYLVRKNKDNKNDYLRDVDWSKTKAFALGLAGIYINLRGREHNGIVDEKDAAELKKELINKIERLRDSKDNNQAVRKVYDTSEVYHGLYAGEAPDLIVGYAPGYRVSWESVKGGFEDEIFTDNLKAWSGDHHVDPECVPGIFFVNRKIKVEDPSIVDIAPTILDLFSVPVPSYMEGKVLF